jgi:hypothetical protein
MIQKLKIPRIHTGVIASLIEACKIGRVSAATSITIGGSIDDFLKELGTTTNIPEEIKRRIEITLVQFEDVWRTYEDIIKKWDNAFWDEGLKNICLCLVLSSSDLSLNIFVD